MANYNHQAELKKLRAPQNIKVLALVSPPSCGKSTRLEGIRQSLTNVTGVITIDMSAIIDWHQDLSNKSSLATDFLEADKVRKQGGLIDDDLVFHGFLTFLTKTEQNMLEADRGPIRNILISGVPRKRRQQQLLLYAFKDAHIAYIDCPYNISNERRLKRISSGTVRDDDMPEVFERRWTSFNSETLPCLKTFADAECNKGRFHVLKHTQTPLEGAQKLLKYMGLTIPAYTSMLHQLKTPGCDAYEFLSNVLNDKKRVQVPQHPHYHHEFAGPGALARA